MLEAIRTFIFDSILYADGYGWKEILKVFFTSMVPVLELRAAIAFGPLHQMPWLLTYLTAVIGNLIPVPFIILFIRQIFSFMKKNKILGGLVERLEAKADRKKGQVLKYASWGLFLFVAVPLPGTGAWTGSLMAAMLDLRLKKAFPAIALGVLTAGVVMTFFYYFLAYAFPDVSYTMIVAVIAAAVVFMLALACIYRKMRRKKGK
ncbi:MAG: small multi-drug export protein [Clostridiales bacterium]|nr:small multi-drug export protein [Clostridiales bacterium]